MRLNLWAILGVFGTIAAAIPHERSHIIHLNYFPTEGANDVESYLVSIHLHTRCPTVQLTDIATVTHLANDKWLALRQRQPGLPALALHAAPRTAI